MKIEGQYLWRDFLQAQRLNTKPHFLTKIIQVIILLFGIALIIFVLLRKELAEYIPLAGVIIIAFLTIISINYLYIPYQIKKLFMQNKGGQLPFVMEIEEKTINIRNEMSNSTRLFSDYIKWKEDEKIITLYISDNMFTMIPKRFLSDEQILLIEETLRNNKVRKETFRLFDLAHIIFFTLFILFVVYEILRIVIAFIS
jgi:hypothetical protein